MHDDLAAEATSAAQSDYPLLLQRMERLMEISHHLTSTLDLGKLLRQIVDAARELTDTEAGSILLLDPATGDLTFEATTNFLASELEGLSVPLDASIAGWVVRMNEPLLVPDTHVDSRWNPQFDELTAFTTKSILCLPLVARGQTIGVLEALNKREREFTDEDMRLLQWLAAQAAVAITNARLFQQSDLVAEMVHELRTPLSALMATSHLLLRPELSDAQHREAVTVLQRETDRLAQLTTDFLDMARLESGRARFMYASFDLADLLRECRQIMQPTAAERAITLSVEHAPALPPLRSDRDKVKQVILNLLTNAVKYNREQGHITLRAEVGPHLFWVFVDDTGPGIEPASLDRLFERFYRVPTAEQLADGTGLGLAIAKRIVEELGGAIGVRSTPGQGSTFYFSLPPKPQRTDSVAA